MTPELQERVVSRLVESGASDKPWALAVLAAMGGAGDARLAAQPEPPGVYVSAITWRGSAVLAQPPR